MALALGGVIYTMRLLQAPGFIGEATSPSNPLSLMLGAELRPMNWCPEKTMKLGIIKAQKDFTDAASISRFCEIMIEPVGSEEINVEDYQLVAVASGEGKEKKLERNSKSVFRVDGFPFHSKQLEKQF